MQTFFHPAQLKHHPRSYLSRGQMRAAQEVPERALRLVEAAKSSVSTCVNPRISVPHRSPKCMA